MLQLRTMGSAEITTIIARSIKRQRLENEHYQRHKTRKIGSRM